MQSSAAILAVFFAVLVTSSSKPRSTPLFFFAGVIGLCLALKDRILWFEWIKPEKRVLCKNTSPITRSLHLPYKPLESTLSDEKLFIEYFSFKICHALMRNNQSTNQCAAQSCSFTCTVFVFWRTFNNYGGKRAGKFIGVIKKQKPVLKIILHWKGLTQGYSTLGGSG